MRLVLAFKKLARRALDRPFALALVLFGAGFCLATRLQGTFEQLEGWRSDPGDPLASFMGESRKLFANHFYIKADAYFHSGFYPTIFDNKESYQTAHMAEDAGVTQSKNTGDENNFLGAASNWIDVHGRKHFPSRHTHLGQDSPDGEKGAGTEREILPWLKLSSKLDPTLVENYTVAAYWLRQLHHPEEAERFLREGLEANPQSVEILFELGRCRFDANDSARARNIWETAWRRWQEQEGNKTSENQDRFLASQVLMHLARLEWREGNRDRSIYWLETLVPLKANPEGIQKRIAEARAGLPWESDPASGNTNPH